MSPCVRVVRARDRSVGFEAGPLVLEESGATGEAPTSRAPRESVAGDDAWRGLTRVLGAAESEAEHESEDLSRAERVE